MYLIEQTIYIATRDFNVTAIENPITLPLLVASILILAIRHPGKLMPRLSSAAAKYSLYIYVAHFLVAIILSRILYGDDIPNKIRYWKGLACWFAIIAITLIAAWIYAMLKKIITQITAHLHRELSTGIPAEAG